MTRLRWLAEAVLVKLFRGVLIVLSRPARLALGRSLGRLVFRVDGRHRRVALANLTLAYPEQSEAWRRDIASSSFEHLGRLLIEILLQAREGESLAAGTEIEGWEHLEAAARAGKGFFVLSGHFGNWEQVALIQAARGVPMWMVTRPLDNPRLEQFLAAARQATGNRVIHKRRALKEIVRGLGEGQGIAFVIDQDFPESAPHFVSFFGKLASTTPALGAIVARTEAPVVPVFAYPKPMGGYRIVYEEPLEIPRDVEGQVDPLAITAAATERIERAVRRDPGAWFWMHQRWRTRPFDEPLDPPT